MQAAELTVSNVGNATMLPELPGRISYDQAIASASSDGAIAARGTGISIRAKSRGRNHR